jgi:DNA mismatch endonuclease (patch repair protein)
MAGTRSPHIASSPPPTRSRIMSAIRGHDTTPERLVRSALHRHGLRFRLHVRGLPGRPDIVLPRHRTVILVHGCFWHRHIGCPRSSLPTHNRAWWVAKLRRNRARDRRNIRDLRAAGWRVIVVWECELGAGRGTAEQRLAKLERFGRALARRISRASPTSPTPAPSQTHPRPRHR